MTALKRPTTLITGASMGIGEEICRRLAGLGHQVLNFSITEAPDDLPAKSFVIDLSDEAQTSELLTEVLSTHQIDHLVNNAGIAHNAKLEDIRLSDGQHLFDVHVRAALQCTQAVVTGMKERRYGRIVNIGSRTMLGKPGATGYALTKAALLTMSRCLSLELAPLGITVNVVAPGPTKTEFFGAVLEIDNPKMIALRDSIPMGRFADAKEVAAAAEYFLSTDAAFTTGQTLYVCGGLSVLSAAL